MLIFKNDYNKNEFYSIMGGFFAERKYKRMMPYLANDENTVWYVYVKNNKVYGFINYIEKVGRISIGYCYVSDELEDNKLLEHNLLTIIHNECINKDMYVEVEKTWDKDSYIELGFEIYKETTNYWYLVKKVNIDESI